jgi:hypothetical protein
MLRKIALTKRSADRAGGVVAALDLRAEQLPRSLATLGRSHVQVSICRIVLPRLAPV